LSKILLREITMRILLVEDDPIIGFAAADALRNEGHEVVGPATTVHDAKHFAREGADFALVDINLAGHDEGVELARNLKSQFGIISAFVSGQSGAAHSNKDAAVGLLRKPYTAQSLIEATAVVAEIASGGSPPPPRVPRAFEVFT
jgi:two-component system, response regulator PdtaR